MLAIEEVLDRLLERVETLSCEKGIIQERFNALTEKVVVDKRLHEQSSLEALQRLMTLCLQEQKNRINQIRVVRELTGLGLKEAKDLVVAAYERAGVEYHYSVGLESVDNTASYQQEVINSFNGK